MQRADGLEWMRGQKEEQLPRPADPKEEGASTTKAAQPRPTRCPGGPRSGTVRAGKRQQAEHPQPATVQDSQEHRTQCRHGKASERKRDRCGEHMPCHKGPARPPRDPVFRNANLLGKARTQQVSSATSARPSSDHKPCFPPYSALPICRWWAGGLVACPSPQTQGC